MRVLFVTKPLVAPWHDGSKNLMRDVVTHLRATEATVLTTSASPHAWPPHVARASIYRDRGRFAPALDANVRVLLHLLRSEEADVWQFAFAPNPASSAAAKFALRVRPGIRSVQTIASAPRSFEHVKRLLFGDRVVALSEWMAERLRAAGAEGVTKIAACAPTPSPTERTIEGLRERLDLGHAPVVLYPGDLEISRGADVVAEAVTLLARTVPEAFVVFACRPKTPRAAVRAAELRARLSPYASRVRFAGEVASMDALLSLATVVVFPVDSLYGKVDHPLVLLEAMALEKPLILSDYGPLRELPAARRIASSDAAGLAAAVRDVLVHGARDEVREALDCYRRSHTPEVVAPRYEEIYRDLVRTGARRAT